MEKIEHVFLRLLLIFIGLQLLLACLEQDCKVCIENRDDQVEMVSVGHLQMALNAEHRDCTERPPMLEDAL